MKKSDNPAPLTQARFLARPFRFYQLGWDALGLCWANVFVQPSYENLIKEHGGYEITAADLADRLKDCDIECSNEGVKLLFHLLNKIACTEHFNDVDLLNYKKVHDDVLSAAEIMVEIGPSIIAGVNDALNAYHHPTESVVRQRHASLVEAVEACRAVLKAWGRPEEFRGKTSWHEDARAIVLILHNTGRHRGRQLGWGKPTSPAIKFTRKVLADLGVSVAKPESVSAEMCRMAAAEGWKRAPVTPNS